jgi:DNA-binding MarR family transcriptional regulator
MGEDSSSDAVSPARELTHALFDLSSAINLIGQAAAVRLGINQTDLICLSLLVRHGPMSAGQVAASLGVTTAAISAMAGRLEAGGYARREIDPADRRRILLHPSPVGAQQAFSLFDDLYQASVELGSRYSQPDVQQLLDVIRRYRALLEQQATALRRSSTDEHP